jgi:hypothetical protein
MFTVRWMALDLWIAWLLVAGAAAVDAARIARPGEAHLAVAARRGGVVFLRAAAWTAVPALLARCVVMALGLAWGGVAAPRGGWAILVLAVIAQLATIAWFTALGSFVGRHLPTVVAGLAGIGSALVIEQTMTTLTASDASFSVFGDMGASVSQIGVTWNPQWLAVQVGVLVPTALLMVLVRISGSPQVYKMPTISGWAAVGVVVAALGIAPALVTGTQMLSRPEPPTSCFGRVPVICVYPEHLRNAAPTRDVIEKLAATATASGYDFMPARLEEASRRYQPGPGVGWIYPIEPGAVNEFLIVDGILSANCPILEDIVPDAYIRNLQHLEDTWLTQYNSDWVALDPTVGPLTPEQVSLILNDFAACELEILR